MRETQRHCRDVHQQHVYGSDRVLKIWDLNGSALHLKGWLRMNRALELSQELGGYSSVTQRHKLELKMKGSRRFKPSDLTE